LNIPARYCTGYISDVNLPPTTAPMDFCAWLEAYIGGRWETFDPRNNAPRTGRVLMARGRDATDTAISNNFGPTTLVKFHVVCEPLVDNGMRERPVCCEVAYASSNGDVWEVVSDRSSGRIAVRHRPNAASGGNTEETELGDFLARRGSGPEYAAVSACAERLGAQAGAWR
jgi:hypothetical protein